MRRLLNLLLLATLLLVPSLSVSSAAAPHRAAVKRVSVKRPAARRVATVRSNPSRVNVRTYTKKTGKVVQAHQRTAPNKTQKDNWSSKGNVNPNTGKPGTKIPIK
jgi:uncharacterized protein (DUF58 family)